MKPLITPAAMRDMEQRWFAETGTPSIDLMERAAQALCEALIKRYGRGKRVYFACGPGGNGGDGYACARMYAQLGGHCAVVPAAPPRTPDAAENLRRARALGIPELHPDAIGERPEIWVDALYGTGLARAPEGASAALIDRMNADRSAGSAVVAVDIPSGLDGESGRAWPACVRADATFTFQYAKPGHFLADGLDACGRVKVLDIGIPESFYPDGMPGLMEDADIRAILPKRPRNLHKGQCGHLLIVAGSAGMAGAAALCAQAALRSGAGLVTVACPASILPVLQTLAPCAMGIPLPERDSAIAPEAVPALRDALNGKDAVVCGCGFSRRAAPEVIRLLEECGLPVLFDADGLNLIAENPELKALLKPHHLITPHPGEAARLLGHRAENPLADAFELRAPGCQALLKGAATVIPVKHRAWISASGGCGMARGGSGDCLSGIIGALMAGCSARFSGVSGPTLAECAAIGSEVHGVAGEIAQAKYGTRGMNAQDIIQALPEAFKRYE